MTVYSVEQLNNYILNMFRNDYLLHDISVRGEISNCKYHSSGHIYFTLKDSASALSCVMFSSNAKKLRFKLENGMEVELRGAVENYVRDGKYQLYVKEAKKGDLGDLAKRFEELKKRLREEGLFDESVKRPIPKDAKKVGIVTAPTGAAVRDIISVSKRRNPYIELILYPAIVQGAEAAGSIVKGIDALERYGVDVIIVGRGGGSMEDLWGFNEEIVAQAIFNCSVPVISAVGHETDVTIADFAADLRAATPSVAAEQAVPLLAPILESIENYEENLNAVMNRKIRMAKMQVSSYKVRLDAASPRRKTDARRMECIRFEERLNNRMNRLLTEKKSRLNLYIERMKRVNVLDRLQSGYSYVSDLEGVRKKSVEDFSPGEKIRLLFRDGAVYAETLSVSKTTEDFLKNE